MEALELLARLGLAATFLVAGLAKLADREGSREALAGFGVPEGLARPGAIALPLAELATAGLLLPAPTATAGAAAALMLLVGFSAGIGRAMARGEAPDCHCFGQIHSKPAGPATLIRNLALAGVAAFALVRALGAGAASPTAWIADLSDVETLALAAGVALAAIAAAGTAVVLQLLRQHGRLLLRIDTLEQALRGQGIAVPDAEEAAAPGLPVGTEAPDFSLPGLHGETITLRALLAAGNPLVLLFTDPNCGPCNALMPAVAGWQREGAGRLTVALVSRGAEADNLAKASEHGLNMVLLESDGEVSSLYEGQATPSAVLIDADGAIASAVAGGEPAIRALVGEALGTSGGLVVQRGGNGAAAPAAGLGVGEPAPDLRLQQLSGKRMRLSSLRGRRTLVLFWDPRCGFCERMLGDLRDFESSPPPGAPELLLISRGSADENREMGLSSRVVLDQDFSAGRAFGAQGTPSAVLLDEEGRVASELGVGADAVLELAGAPA